jgi:hypothetical protein
MSVRPESKHLEERAGDLLRLRGFDPPKASHEFEIFERVEPIIQHWLVGQPGNDAFGLNRMPTHVYPKDLDCAAVRDEEPCN